MDKEFTFSTKIPAEWKEIINILEIDKGLEYLKDSQDKIFFATLDINLVYYFLDKKKEAYKEWNEKLFKDECISGSPNNNIEYCNQEIPSEILISKTSMNFFTSLHSFFDNYSYFLHLCLLPNKNVPDRLDFGNMLKTLKDMSEFENIYNTILDFKKEKFFDYIVNVDNINKHRSILSPRSITWLNDGKIETEMPKFDKNGKSYSEEQMIDALEDSLNLVNDFYKAITEKVFEYLETVVNDKESEQMTK